MYEVFRRDWYSIDENGKKICQVGESIHIAYVDTIQDARELCKEYNDENEPGGLSHKAEFRSV